MFCEALWTSDTRLYASQRASFNRLEDASSRRFIPCFPQNSPKFCGRAAAGNLICAAHPIESMAISQLVWHCVTFLSPNLASPRSYTSAIGLRLAIELPSTFQMNYKLPTH